MKKAEVFFDAITAIRSELIDEALDYRFAKRAVRWRRYMSLAACLALVAVVGFGALRFGLLGGMGGSDSASSSNCAAPETAENTGAAGDDAAMDPGNGNYGGDGGEGQMGEAVTMTAAVLEVHDAYLLVEPVEGDPALMSADRIEVPTGGLENLPELAEGDVVTVTYTGGIQETYPARLTGVVAVEKQGTP